MDERIEIEVEGGSESPAPRGGGGGGLLGVLVLLPGLGFIALGVAIIAWPRLIEYLLAGVCFLIGLGLLFAARKFGQARKKVASFKAQFSGSSWGPSSGP